MERNDQVTTQDIRESWLGKLTEQGFRMTKPLSIITGILADSDHILNPAQVYQLAKEIYPRIGLVTVYRAMEKLEQAGLISRVHMPDGCQSFFQAHQGHQHLLVCLTCGKAEYFEGDDLSSFFNSTGEKFGYQIKDHWLQLFGHCPQCQ